MKFFYQSASEITSFIFFKNGEGGDTDKFVAPTVVSLADKDEFKKGIETEHEIGSVRNEIAMVDQAVQFGAEDLMDNSRKEEGQMSAADLRKMKSAERTMDYILKTVGGYLNGSGFVLDTDVLIYNSKVEGQPANDIGFVVGPAKRVGPFKKKIREKIYEKNQVELDLIISQILLDIGLDKQFSVSVEKGTKPGTEKQFSVTIINKTANIGDTFDSVCTAEFLAKTEKDIMTWMKKYLKSEAENKIKSIFRRR